MNGEARRLLGGLCVLLIVSVLVWYVIGSAGKSAEFAYLAVSVSTRAVEKFVKVNGRWPKSWDELEAVSLDPGPIYVWPEDLPRIESQVEINFDLTLEEVAGQEPNDFAAIQPKRPAYSGYKRDFASLVSTVRLVLSGQVNEDEQAEYAGCGPGGPG